MRCVGSEDFSRERYNKELKKAFVWVWDGVKRNKGGYRWFNMVAYITYRKDDAEAVKEYYKHKYNANMVQLRKW